MKLTESELKICEHFGAKWLSMDYDDRECIVEMWLRKPVCVDGKFYKSESDLGGFLKNYFPSIKPGDCICVEDCKA